MTKHTESAKTIRLVTVDNLSVGDLVRMVDELHDTSHVSDALWKELAAVWTPPQLIELLMLAGWYHAISYVCNATGVPLESWAARFGEDPCGQMG